MNEANKNEHLIFVFNADSDTISTIKDFFHKMVKPSTYSCNLCAVSYGRFGMKKEWTEYVSDLEEKVDVKFFHKDEFQESYSLPDAKYPCAYFLKNNTIKLFISQEEMNTLNTVEELKSLVDEKLPKFL